MEISMRTTVGQAILPAAAFQAVASRHVRVSGLRGRRLKAGRSQDWLPHSIAVVALATTMLAGGALGQAQSGQVIGEVTALDPQSRQISLKTDQGEAVTVTVGDSTSFRRVPPGAKDLTTATRIAFPDLGVGDRIVAIGQRSDDRRKVEARTVIAMSRSDLAQKRLQEQEEWQKRGVSGTVLAVDPGAHTFTIKSGPKNVAIQPSGKTEYRRYSPDSVKFSDAQPSSLAEIKVGDQVRVLGDKAGDGASIAAERIVSGSFRQIAATISSVNAETGEVVVKDLATKKTLTVRVNADSTMRRLPPAMAAAMARRYQPGAAKGEDTGQTLDRLPAMPLSELKRGDAIMLSSTTGSDPARVMAVMLLAGVEPLLTASPTATRDIMSGWNLGGGGDQ